MKLHPTNKLLDMLRQRGVQWPEVEADLAEPETITPVPGFNARRRLSGEDWQGYVEPDRSGEPDSWVLVGVRERERAEPPAEPVIGVDRSPSLPRSRGGSGRRWPTTWEELAKRAKAHGCRFSRAGKHIVVYRDGVQITSLPVSSSDWRALVNACHQLRRAGVDVSRRVAAVVPAVLWLTDALPGPGSP